MKISGKLTQEEKPVVTVVLDALDECDNPGARSNFLTVLAGQTVTLASSLHFEFVITSRTEPDICSESFKIHHGSHVRRHELDTISDANTTHILLYFQHRASLTRIRNKYSRLSGGRERTYFRNSSSGHVVILIGWQLHKFHRCRALSPKAPGSPIEGAGC